MPGRNDLKAPASEAEVTVAWVRAALTGSLPRVVGCKAIRLERIGADYGFASEIFRCLLINDNTTESVVIKLWPTNTPAGVAEILFYETFGGKMADVPVCFHAAVDSDRCRGVLVLEDLRAAIQGDCLQQLTTPLATRVVRALAAVHAAWLQDAEITEAGWLRSVSLWKPEAAWFASRRAAFREQHPEKLDEFSGSLLDRIERVPAVVNERLAGSPITLLHGDLHLDNVLFQRDRAIILDWARCAKGPLVFDLVEVLFQMCEPENVDSILSAYIGAFNERSTTALDTQSIRRQLGGALLRQFTFRMCGIANWQPVSRRQQMIIETDIRRAVIAVQHWAGQDPDLFSFLRS